MLVCSLIGPASLQPHMWGSQGWYGLEYGTRAALFVTGVALCSRGFGGALDRLWHIAPLPRTISIPALIAFAGLLWIARTEVFWGNPDIAAEDAIRGRVNLKHPLSASLLALVSAAGARLGGYPTGPNAVRWVSVASGAVFALGAAALGRALFPESRVKSRVVCGVFLSSTIVQQFCGVIETYPAATAMQMWTLAAIAHGSRTDEPSAMRWSITALVLAGFNAGFFIATIFLAPAAVLVFLMNLRKRGRSSAALVAGACAFLIAPAIAFVAVATRGYSWRLMLASFGGVDGTAWVQLSEGARPHQHFTLLSLHHASARWNASIFAAPMWPAAAAAVLSSRSHDARPPWLPALGLAALSALSFFVLIHPDLGPASDWMQTATGVVAPFALLVAWGLSKADDGDAARWGTAAVGASTLITIPTILMNARILG